MVRTVVPRFQGVKGRRPAVRRTEHGKVGRPSEPEAPGRRKVSAARQAWQSIADLFFFSADVHRRMQGMCEATGFTPGLVKALLSPALQHGTPVPMRTLAGEWSCDPSYVTLQVRELEQRGLVERRFNPQDHRFKTVALTDKGEQMRVELFDQLLEPPECFGVLSAAEQRQLRDLLQKLVAAAPRSACDTATEVSDAG
jgi:DNA-binding MarR family transcriptional regulator